VALLIGSLLTSAGAFVAASLLVDPFIVSLKPSTSLMVQLNFLRDPPRLLCMPSYGLFVPSRLFDARKTVSVEGGVCGGVI
jgi:hypothetical protein